MAAASIKNGLIFWNCTVGRGYKKEDVAHFLNCLKHKFGNIKFAVFLDNAKIHDNDFIRAHAFDIGVPLIYNLKYRPELNGIENLWVHTKIAYKKHITHCRYTGQSWNNHAICERLISEVPRDIIVKGLEKGMQNILNAKPILPRHAESVLDDVNELDAAFADCHIDDDADYLNE